MKSFTRIVVAHADRQRRQALCLQLEAQGLFTQEACDGRQALDWVAKMRPSGLLLSMTLPALDGAAVLAALRGLPLSHFPFVLALTALGEESAAAALRGGADEALVCPFSESEAAAHIQRLIDTPVSALGVLHAQARLPASRRIVSELGMPSALKGYGYLSSSVALCSVNKDLLEATTGKLYPLLAREDHTTPMAVERAIRHAIESTWTHGAVEVLNALFGNSVDPQRGKPTNTECIARLCQRLLEEMGGTL